MFSVCSARILFHFFLMLMLTYTTLSSNSTVTDADKERIVDFLFEQLGRYGDAKQDIFKAMEYALHPSQDKGGFVMIAEQDGVLVGAVVINRTGMEGYIPENILVYIATHSEQRGKGIGKELMQRVMAMADGDIALHVEPDNPAKRLYDRLGFTNKYLEMRYKKTQ